MIYLCQNCGWRINTRLCIKQRISNEPKEIGSHLLYCHKPFCSDWCIEEAKKHPYILERTVKPSDWNEPEWKINRKLRRGKRPKNRHEKEIINNSLQIFFQSRFHRN